MGLAFHFISFEGLQMGLAILPAYLASPSPSPSFFLHNPWPPFTARSSMLTITKTSIVCSSQEANHGHDDHEAEVPSPAPKKKESLIERNLRNRAASRNDGGRISSSATPHFLATSSNGDNEGRPKLPTNIVWEEKPPHLCLSSFRTLDVHVARFRTVAFLFLADGSTLSLHKLASIFWDHVFVPSQLPFGLSSLWHERQENVAEVMKCLEKENVGEEMKCLVLEKERLVMAAAVYAGFYKIHSADAFSSLMTVLALSAEIEIFSGVLSQGGKNAELEKDLESASASLRLALTKLHGGGLDPIELWEKCVRGTSFLSDGGVFVFEYAVIFSGTLSTRNGTAGQELLEKVQHCLDKHEKFHGRVALLLKSEEKKEEVYLVLAPWYWVICPAKDNYTGLKLLLMVSASAATFFSATSPGLNVSGILWEPYLVTLGYLAILRSAGFANQIMPFFFPFYPLGALGKTTPFPIFLPSRTSYLHALLDTSCAALVVSFLLLATGHIFWGPSHYHSLDVLDLSGYVLTPTNLFAYSGVFTKVLNSISVAAVKGENGDILLAVPPFSLAGLLGLNYVAFSLLPVKGTDGAKLLANLVEKTKLTKMLSLGLSGVTLLSLYLMNPGLVLVWTACSLLDTGSFAKDEVTEPNFFIKLIGLAIMISGITCFVPWS